MDCFSFCYIPLIISLGGKTMSIGKTILNVRKEKGMSQEEFGELFHVTRQTVSNWENEKNYPDLNTLVTMSDMFEISLDKLLVVSSNL